jgi:hypothetical protein
MCGDERSTVAGTSRRTSICGQYARSVATRFRLSGTQTAQACLGKRGLGVDTSIDLEATQSCRHCRTSRRPRSSMYRLTSVLVSKYGYSAKRACSIVEDGAIERHAGHVHRSPTGRPVFAITSTVSALGQHNVLLAGTALTARRNVGRRHVDPAACSDDPTCST